jgi:ABC-type polysaccharide/polyol phosphate transport system ATPase subunit
MSEYKNAIEVNNVSKKFRLYHEKSRSLKQIALFKRQNIYEDFWVLNDINFNVEPGTTLALVGGNGSGKSTLLKMVAKILKPNKGNIKVNGRVSALLELGAGFQQDYTGRENVFLNGSILGLSEKEIKRRFDDIVGFAELEKFIDTPVRNYSSGMYMRLAFSIAVSVDPDVLLIDEVLAVGDEAFQRKCFEKINSFKVQGKTILFVSHDPLAVSRLCEKAVLLDKGQMVMMDSADKVIDRYRGILSNRQQRAEVHGDEPAEQLKVSMDNIFYNRFGTRQAEILGVSFLNPFGEDTEVVNTGDATTIEVRAKFHEDINNPIFGCIIRKENDGVLYDVYDTNTMWQNQPTGSFKKGDEVIIRYSQTADLGRGMYYISTAIASADTSVFYDWHDNVKPFHVLDDATWRGISNLRAKITVS